MFRGLRVQLSMYLECLEPSTESMFLYLFSHIKSFIFAYVFVTNLAFFSAFFLLSTFCNHVSLI